jgi:cytochrome P450
MRGDPGACPKVRRRGAGTDDSLMTDAPVEADFLLADGPARHAGNARLGIENAVHRIGLRSGTTGYLQSDMPGYLVTGYRAARRALTDPRLKGRTGAVGDRRAMPEELRLAMNSHMLNLEPPDHTRLRRLVSTGFTRVRMERMRPRIQQIADELLDAMSGQDEVDLLEALATPLPIRVLTELIGVPEESADAFRGWTKILTEGWRPIDEIGAAAMQMLRFTRSLLELKRGEPKSDLLSALVAVRDGEDRLTEDELTSMVFLLLIAGQETTVNLIANAVVSLTTNPGQLARLRADPALLTSTIEEVLRYESPVQAALRYAAEDVRLAGVTIPAGSVVIISLLAANRDGNRFDHPDQLDLAREQNPQIAFGHGIHHCLGAPLARLEGATAVGALVRRFPNLRLAVPAETLTWRVSLVMHGVVGLPVRLR